MRWEEEYCVKAALGPVAHLPAMLPCSFEDHLSVASLKCFHKGEQWTCHRKCPWNKSAAFPGGLKPSARPMSAKKMEWGINHRRPNSGELILKKRKLYTFSSLLARLCRFSFALFSAMFTLQPPSQHFTLHCLPVCVSGSVQFPGIKVNTSMQMMHWSLQKCHLRLKTLTAQFSLLVQLCFVVPGWFKHNFA